MDNNTNYQILAKFLSGECTEEEKKFVNEWLLENPDNKVTSEKMKSVWQTSDDEFDKSDIKSLWNKLSIKAGIDSTPKELDDENLLSKLFTSNKNLRYAASITLLILLPSIFYFLSGSSNYLLTIKPDDQNIITLNDGSVITLDVGSTFEYPETFEDDKRLVKLNGQAFFEVSHNKKAPFIVETNNSLIKVLGTKFNIRSWSNENSTKVEVSEGKVAFGKLTNEEDTVHITKGFVSELQSNGTLTRPKETNTDSTLTWIDGELYFVDASLSEVIIQIERWYDVKIEVTNKSILNDQVTVSINNKSLRNNLELISEITDTKFSINEKVIKLFE